MATEGSDVTVTVDTQWLRTISADAKKVYDSMRPLAQPTKDTKLAPGSGNRPEFVLVRGNYASGRDDLSTILTNLALFAWNVYKEVDYLAIAYDTAENDNVDLAKTDLARIENLITALQPIYKFNLYPPTSSNPPAQ